MKTIETKEEKSTIKEVENEVYKSVVGEEKESVEDMLFSAAKQTQKSLQSRKSVTLRLFERDIEKIKASAMHVGMPYQTYLAHIIHKISTGQIKLA